MNLDTYTSEMAKSVWDKSFFMDKIPGAKCIIDFGCADGTMIHFLAPLFPDITFVGYDISMELIDRARNTTPHYSNIIYFDGSKKYNDQQVINFVKSKFQPEEICINFSSVLHEVFSSTGGIEVIHKFVRQMRPKYITIRDMYCDEHLTFTSEQFWQILDSLDFWCCNEFTHKYGRLNDWHDLTHLLMKIQWKDNGWKEELEENYYSWNIYDFISRLDHDYIIAFDCRYQLPYLSEKWKKEYGWYNPDIHTHAQFILRRWD